MFKQLPIFALFVMATLAIASCASKKFYKQANKFAEAGLYRDAAQMYYQSVAANNKNIEAKLGLQRTGQLVLQEKLASFKTHFDNNATKEAVYAFIDANNYFNQIKNVGITLVFPPENNVYYEEVKEKYLHSRYADGLQTLDVEDFTSAEQDLQRNIEHRQHLQRFKKPFHHRQIRTPIPTGHRAVQQRPLPYIVLHLYQHHKRNRQL
jgi:hypothetical protein